MSRLFTVARREYLERIRSRAFWIGTIVGPLLLVGFTLGPALFSQRGKDLRIAVVDAGGGLREAVERVLREPREDPETARFLPQPTGEGEPEAVRERLQEAILAGGLDGYVYLAPDALEKSEAEYYARTVSDLQTIRRLGRAVEEALVAVRLSRDGLDPARVKALTRRLDLKPLRVSASGQHVDRGGGFIFSLMLMMFLYTTTLMWGQAVLSSVIEEKTSRVVEVLASSISATTVFAGKLLGVGAAGLTQFLVWVLSLAVVAALAGGGGLPGGMTLPEIPPSLLFFFVLYFLLGYFLYANLYAAVGAAVNSIQEAQHLIFPLLLPLIAAVMCFRIVLQQPDSTLSIALSLFPFFTPLLMFLRISVLMPPAWQIALSILLTLTTIAGLTWASARVYRVGILMYGKRPTLPEILRWIRHT